MGGYGIVGGNLPIAAGLALASDYKGEDDGHRLHVRRRRLEHRQLRRDDEPGGALEAAGRLHRREQPLRDGDLGRAPLGADRPLEEGRGLRGPGRAGRRHGRDRGARGASPRGSGIAREERRPTLLEAFTYRYRGHSAADPEVYREREEVEEWREKDPIETFARRCVEAGVLGEREVQEVRDEGRASRSMEAVEFAEASPEPALDTLYENLYVVGDDAGLVRGRRAQPGAAPRRARGRGDARRGARAGRGGRRLRRASRRRPRPNPAERRRRRGGRRAEVAEARIDGAGAAEEVEADGDAADARGAARRDGGGDAPRRGRSS